MKTEYRLKDDKMLLLPIKVQAIVIGRENNVQYANVTPNYTVLDDSKFAQNCLGIEFGDVKELEKGVHLHWFLPDALTKGIYNEKNGDMLFLNVPNRWIINRIVTNKINTRHTDTSIKSFIVESDFISKTRDRNNKKSPSMPIYRETENKTIFADSSDNSIESSYVFLGRSGELGSLESANTYMDNLTAVAYGNTEFCAYYPNCRNVFGFYDDLEDVESGNIMYQICGWYSDDKDEPLGNIKSDTEFEDILKKYNWKIADDKDFYDDNKLYYRILCQGNLFDIDWCGKNSSYQNGIPENKPKVSVGSSSTEALASLISSELEADDYTEKLFGMFMSDLINHWTDSDGIIVSEEKMHENMFEFEKGGISWMLKQKEGEDDKIELNFEIGKLLDDLNKAQKDYDKLQDRIRFKEKEIYFAWYCYAATIDNSVEEIENNKSNKNNCINSIKKYILEYRDLINDDNKLKSIIEEYKENLMKCEVKIAGDKEVSSKLEEYYDLIAYPNEKFWKANEPVILLSGEGMEQIYNSSKSSGNMEKDNALVLRYSSSCIDKLNISSSNEDKSITIYGDSLIEYLNMNDNLPRQVLPLIKEALLLSKSWIDIIADIFFIHCGERVDHTEYETVKDKILKVQRAPWKAITKNKKPRELAEKLGYSGVFPEKICMNYYIPSWNPLYMEWEISFIPEKECLDNNSITSNWKLEDTDYKLRKKASLANDSVNTFRGRTILTPHIVEQVSDVIDKYMDTLNNGTIKNAFENIKNKIEKSDILSQKLSGFNNYFLSEKQAVHYPMSYVWEYKELLDKTIDKDLFNNVESSIDNNVHVDPNMDSLFMPVRAGFMEIAQLRIIDSFGRVKNVIEKGKKEMNSDFMSISMNLNNEELSNKIILQPRIMQSSRFDFSFISLKGDEIKTNIVGETSPIIGWIVPNYIDYSLMIYDEKGEPRGTFLTVKDVKGNFDVVWMNLPNKSLKSDTNMTDLPTHEDMNEELTNYIRSFSYSMKSMVKKNSEVLNEFVTFLSDKLCSMNVPKANFKVNMMNFIGRPLALVGVKIGLETKEPFHYNQTWNLKDNNKENVLREMSFEVKIGDERKKNDGVIGFYEYAKGYENFYTYKDKSKVDKGYIVYNNTIQLKFHEEKDKNEENEANKKYTHVLLMDPMLDVNLISGILPVKTAHIPLENINYSLEKLDIEMLCAPILSNENKVKLPLDIITGREWEFIYSKRKSNNAGDKIKEYLYENKLKNVTQDASLRTYPIMIREGYLKLSKEE